MGAEMECGERPLAAAAVVLAEVDLGRPRVVGGHQQCGMADPVPTIETEADQIFAVGLDQPRAARHTARRPASAVAPVAVGADREQTVLDEHVARVKPTRGIATGLAPVQAPLGTV